MAALLPLCGRGIFLASSKATIGRTTFELQRTVWANKASLPWTTLTDSWRHVVAGVSQIERLNLALILLFTLILALGFRRIPFPYTLLAAAQIGLLLFRQGFTSPFSSASRYLLVVFPIYAIVALWGRHRPLHLAWVGVSLLLLLIICRAFLTGAFIA